MRTFICAAAIWLVFFIVDVSSVHSQVQIIEGYTVIRGATGPQICLGRWVPSRDVALPGSCEGQIIDLNQFAAISSRLSADRLDQILSALASIDQRLAVNNDSVQRLIEATVSTQTSIDQQVSKTNELLSETISQRFDAISEEILSNKLFKEEIKKLKEDILKEVEKYYSKRPKSSTQ